jgi:hypothetical protein
MFRWLSAVAWAGVLLAQACSPTYQSGVLLTVVSPGEAPTWVEVLWLDGDRHLLLRRRFPDAGELPVAWASRFTLFIEMQPAQLGPRRVVIYGKVADRTVGQGMVHIDDLSGGRRDVEVVLGPDRLADADEDGIPDELDVCPRYPAFDGRCPDGPDGGAAGSDGAPVSTDADQPAADAAPEAGSPGELDAASAGPLPPPPPPAFTMGTFTKVVGPAGTEQRVLHELGAVPRALLLWTTAGNREGFAPGIHFSLGVSDGPSGVTRALGFASADAVTSNRASRRIVDQLLSVGDADGSTAAEAALVGWDASSFTLRWTVSNSLPYIIHALVIGGDGVRARVVDWETPVSDGVAAVAGVGFAPEVVMNLHVGLGFSSTSPGVRTGGSFGVGVMTRDRGQWANALAIPSPADPGETRRVQRTDAAIYLLARDQTLLAPEAVFRSMDPDGFSLDFRNARLTPTRVISLALAGVSAAAGSFPKATGPAPVEQKVAAVGFRPGLILLSSVARPDDPEPAADTRWVWAGADGSRTACSTLGQTSRPPFTRTGSLAVRDRVFVKADPNLVQIEAEAALPTLDSDGFTLPWLSNDAIPVQITYLALGPAPR